MMIMSEWVWGVSISLILCITVLGMIISWFLLNKKVQVLEKKNTAIERVLKQSRQQNEALYKQQQTFQLTFQEMHHHLTVFMEEQEHLSLQQQDIIKQGGDNKLYQRASKMVALGADVSELMSECDMPKAEAELFVSLQKKIYYQFQK